jgi:hypothetical protein
LTIILSSGSTIPVVLISNNILILYLKLSYYDGINSVINTGLILSCFFKISRKNMKFTPLTITDYFLQFRGLDVIAKYFSVRKFPTTSLDFRISRNYFVYEINAAENL